jgi:hypothetical protein
MAFTKTSVFLAFAIVAALFISSAQADLYGECVSAFNKLGGRDGIQQVRPLGLTDGWIICAAHGSHATA